MIRWRRQGDNLFTVYRSDCGRYTIEKFDGLMRGSPVWWILTGAAGEHQRKTLRVAKRVAELHARTSVTSVTPKGTR